MYCTLWYLGYICESVRAAVSILGKAHIQYMYVLYVASGMMGNLLRQVCAICIVQIGTSVLLHMYVLGSKGLH